MEGLLCTCSLVCFLNIFFLFISSTINASQGVFFEDLDLFPFSVDKEFYYKAQAQQPPLNSPSVSPALSPSLKHHKSFKHHPSSKSPLQPKTNEVLSSNPEKKGLNNGKIAGLVLVSIAGLLQVVVLAYLLVKRRQMLRVVEKYEV